MRWMLTLLLLWIAALPTRAAEPAATTSNLLLDWHDAARDRDVPAKVYYPSEGTAPHPVIIFSHGLGGSREAYASLGTYWATHGYVSVHLQHAGSDTAVWQGMTREELKEFRSTPLLAPETNARLGQRLREGKAAKDSGPRTAINAENIVNRCKDVSFAIDELTKINVDATSPLKGRLDLKHIGMAGHSFGANTTMLIAGQSAGLAAGKSPVAESRIIAAIAISPPPPARAARYKEAYAPITMPLMVMSGTEDNLPESRTANVDRHAAFPFLTNSEAAYLVTYNGGNHSSYMNSRLPAAMKASDARFHRLTELGTTAFWDAYLRDDAKSKAWLDDGQFTKELAKDGTLEITGVE